MKKITALFCAMLVCMGAFSQRMQTCQFAEKDGTPLYMDVYTPVEVTDSTVTVVYIFGGGFLSGQRNDEMACAYCSRLAADGFLVVAIDYRLGLVGEKNIGLFNHKPLEKAIQMATEDAVSALDYLARHADELKVNPEWIVLVGSSAGAVTALETDYAICNGLYNAAILPQGFRLAGVASYAGAVLSHEGKVRYRYHAPAPTMLFHGMSDKLVTYKQLRLFKLGFYGSSKLATRFEKNDYPYYFRRYKDYGHSVAAMFDSTVDELEWFVRNYVMEARQWQVDETFTNMDKAQLPAIDGFSPSDLYK